MLATHPQATDHRSN